MKSMEEQFEIKKERLKAMEVPEELEERLNNALKFHHRKNSNFFIRHKTAASVIIIILMFSIYNFDVLAYYGRKIMGYDQVIYGSLKDLNELGEGQQIGKSYTFKDGSQVILDGVFLDENKLVAMYRIKSESQDKAQDFNNPEVKGIFWNGRGRGRGLYNEELKELAWIFEFDSPHIFNKYITFSLTSKDGEKGKINFGLDMSKVVKGIVKQKINKSIEADGVKYNFDALSASPLSTVIEGNIEAGSKLQLFTGGKMKDVTRNMILELSEIYEKDGKLTTETLKSSSWNLSCDTDRAKFKYEFEGLKKGLKQLELKVLRTEDMKIIDKEIKINDKTKNVCVDSVKISDVKTDNGNTVITFITDKDVTFAAGLMINGNEAKLISEASDYIDGGNSIKRTSVYKGNGPDMNLMFKTVSRLKLINRELILYKAAS